MDGAMSFSHGLSINMSRKVCCAECAPTHSRFMIREPEPEKGNSLRIRLAPRMLGEKTRAVGSGPWAYIKPPRKHKNHLLIRNLSIPRI
jgi:hypothetical protein